MNVNEPGRRRGHGGFARGRHRRFEHSGGVEHRGQVDHGGHGRRGRGGHGIAIEKDELIIALIVQAAKNECTRVARFGLIARCLEHRCGFVLRADGR